MDARRVSLLRVIVTSVLALGLLAGGWTVGKASAAGTAKEQGAITSGIGAGVRGLQTERPGLARTSSIAAPGLSIRRPP